MGDDKVHFENKQVEVARTMVCGHFHSIEIQLCFDDCIISINPKRSWFAENGINKLGKKEYSMPFFDLFNCFDLDCEDGSDVESISGKYCRILFGGCTPIAIYHITKPVFVLIENLK